MICAGSIEEEALTVARPSQVLSCTHLRHRRRNKHQERVLGVDMSVIVFLRFQRCRKGIRSCPMRLLGAVMTLEHI